MSRPPYFDRWAQWLINFWFMALPRKRPSTRSLQRCKLVSHRGEHDNLRIRENTPAAFDQAVSAGVWGIEFDVRWTRDLQPIVIHDPDTSRVFGIDVAVAEVAFEDLRQRVPEVPTLAEVVVAYGGVTHLMIELKPDALGHDVDKTARLAEILSPLHTRRDYHFLALDIESLKPAAFAGSKSCILVAETNTAEISRQALDGNLGGICGHYLLLKDRIANTHRSKGHRLGTGFVTSRFGFYRELNRGVDWIFTNHAQKLCDIRDRLLRRS